MPFAINIRSDNETAQPIRELWQRLQDFEPAPTMQAMNYPPHLTLAIYEDVPESELFAAVDGVAAGPIKVRFESLGCFTPPNGLVIWAAPRVTRPLRRLHQSIHSRIDTQRCHANYRPKRWIPHCTLALNVAPEFRAEAKALTEQALPPFEVAFDVVDCTSFHPVEVLRERRLKSTGQT